MILPRNKKIDAFLFHREPKKPTSKNYCTGTSKTLCNSCSVTPAVSRLICKLALSEHH